jgi:hypothetical protein
MKDVEQRIRALRLMVSDLPPLEGAVLLSEAILQIVDTAKLSPPGYECIDFLIGQLTSRNLRSGVILESYHALKRELDEL